MARKCEVHDAFVRTLPGTITYSPPAECEEDAEVYFQISTQIQFALNDPIVGYALCGSCSEKYDWSSRLQLIRKMAAESGTPLLEPRWSTIRQ